MKGKASEIKTVIVSEVGGTLFSETLNAQLRALGNSEIIDIQFKSTADKEGVAWFNALIVYKEDTHE